VPPFRTPPPLHAHNLSSCCSPLDALAWASDSRSASVDSSSASVDSSFAAADSSSVATITAPPLMIPALPLLILPPLVPNRVLQLPN
jgi:hypothetical protein